MKTQPLAIVFLMLLTCAATARGEAGVRDEAGFFSTDAVRRAESTIADMRQRFGKELLIETIPSVPADRAGALQAQGKERFFENLAAERAQAHHVNGIYVLISRQPSYLETVVGNTTAKRAFTLQNRDELTKIMLASLRQKDNDGALLKGVDYVQRTLAQNMAGATAKGNSAAAPAVAQGRTAAPQAAPDPAAPRRGPGIGTFLFLILGVGLAIAVVRRLVNRRQSTLMPPPVNPNDPRNVPGAGYGPGYDPRYGQPGGGYGPGAGGGGFGRGILGGLLGGVAGGWLYDRMGHHGEGVNPGATTPPPQDPSGLSDPQGPDSFYLGGSGGEFGDTGGSADAGGGGDFAGGDAGGGDFGGGDAGGGGDFGGGGDSGGGGSFDS
jgi:uncharacterized protein